MNEFIAQDGQILLNVPYAEAYLPMALFTTDEEHNSSVAVQYADGFKTMGLFNMRFYQSPDDDRNSVPLRTFNYPNMIMTYPTDFTASKLQLTPNQDPEQYLILKYEMGDVIMQAEEVENIANCTKLLNMITRGKIPNTIPYDKFVEMWEANFAINSFNARVPSVVLQMVWSEMCRCPEDITKPYRTKWGKGDASTTGYTETNMNNVAAANSVFSALSFERIKEKLATSINMTNSGVEQRRSPVEEVLTM